jgi:hypothetical protein
MMAYTIGRGQLALPVMIREIPFQQYPRLPFLKGINVPNQVQHMIFQFPNILHKHHLFLERSKAQVLFDIVANYVAHDVKCAQKEQYRDLIFGPDGFHERDEGEGEDDVVEFYCDVADLDFVETCLYVAADGPA